MDDAYRRSSGAGANPASGAPGHPSTGIRARSVLRSTAYPVLLTATLATAAAAVTLGWEPALVSPLFLMGVLSYLTVLEQLIPHDRSWHPTRSEWRWYGVYFLLTMAGSAVAQSLVSLAVSGLAPSGPRPLLWAETAGALLTGSLISYAMHRFSHVNPLLWRLHGVHHVPRKVNVANNGVNHVLDIVLAQGLVQLGLALAGFSREAVLASGLFVAAQGYFAHANIDVRIGPLNHLLASPEQHRLHHSTDLAEAGHYGSDLAVWDHLFRSYTWRPGRRPAAIGLGDPSTFPGTGEIVSTLLHPLRPRRGESGPG
ncbi:sterol desaturase family protein [Streptomyces sp. NPDC000594]|uniref:sterol desaturase family protein n=1 Tax=Streptomyces sp. NPDC000594 TaxID=3154261 RepID=UPI003332A335